MNVEMLNISIKSHYLTILLQPVKKNRHSLRSATWWTTLMQSPKLCLLLCNTRWWFYCNKKSEDNPTLIGWNEWTRTTDPHLIFTWREACVWMALASLGYMVDHPDAKFETLLVALQHKVVVLLQQKKWG